jgi:electron transport complex protein RnfE
VFIPLIVVNCMVLGRAEAFASKNGVLASAVDGLCQGIGYTVALVITCIIRELLGNGTFGGGLLNGGEGIRIISEGYPAMQLVMPVGGFLVLGFVIAGSQWLMQYLEKRNKQKEAAK